MSKTNRKCVMHLFCIIFACTISSVHGLFAQVTIGSDESPEKAALLQVKDFVMEENATEEPGGITAKKGGLLLPRVALTKRTELYPFLPTGYDVTEKMKHKGLTVYNINAVEEEELSEGFYIWNGEEWGQLTITPGKAKADMICARIKVNGTYYAGVPLNSGNTITIRLNVTTVGEYTIVGRSNNGYYFQANGIFDEKGEYTIDLLGMGTPTNPTPVGETDEITFLLNNKAIVCKGTTNPATAEIVVLSPIVTYTIDCGDISVHGEYNVRKPVDNTHYVSIPVEVLYGDPANQPVVITSNTVNGLRFSTSVVVDPSTTEFKLQAYGTPTAGGAFTYEFTTTGANVVTCTFRVNVTTTLGSFDDPAKNCYAIYQDDPTIRDGEYWILNPQTESPTKTFCDMTNGGYTLIWSYSEGTVYAGGGIYGSANNIQMGSNANMSNNAPQNLVTAQNGTINYDNFRLNNQTMVNARTSYPGEYRVRIAYVPTDMNDKWGVNNYFQSTSATNVNRDYISSTNSYYNNGRSIVGKLFGLNYTQGLTDNDGYYNGVRSGSVYHYIGNTTWGAHWDVGTRFANGSYSGVFPVHPNDVASKGETLTYNFEPQRFNNLFGGHHENEINHHFGKCPGDDYNFTTMNCGESSRVPHSFNGGKGRYMQWFVK